MNSNSELCLPLELECSASTSSCCPCLSILFTSLNMIITNTKEDHFIIRGLPNIDLQIFLVCGISIHRKYWGKLEARQHCLLLFDLSLALFIISTKVKTNNTWLMIQQLITPLVTTNNKRGILGYFNV